MEFLKVFTLLLVANALPGGWRNTPSCPAGYRKIASNCNAKPVWGSGTGMANNFQQCANWRPRSRDGTVNKPAAFNFAQVDDCSSRGNSDCGSCNVSSEYEIKCDNDIHPNVKLWLDKGPYITCVQDVTTAPTPSPTTAPTPSPTTAPTQSPTTAPTPSPTTTPTPSPTTAPTPSPTTAPTPSPTTACTKKAEIDWTGTPRTGASTWATTDTAGHEYDCKASSVIETASASSECECHNVCHGKHGHGCGFYEFNAQAKTCAMFTTRCDLLPIIPTKTETGPCAKVNTDYPAGSADLAPGLPWKHSPYGSFVAKFDWNQCLEACKKSKGCTAFSHGMSMKNCFVYKKTSKSCAIASSWRPHYDFFTMESTTRTFGQLPQTVPAEPALNRGTPANRRYQVYAQGVCKNQQGDFSASELPAGYAWKENQWGSYTFDAPRHDECYDACLKIVGCKSFSTQTFGIKNTNTFIGSKACFVYKVFDCAAEASTPSTIVYDRYRVGEKYWRAEFGMTCEQLGGEPIQNVDECELAEAETRNGGQARLNSYAIKNKVTTSNCFVDKKILYFNPSAPEESTINYNEFGSVKSANICKGQKKLYVAHTSTMDFSLTLQGAGSITNGCNSKVAEIKAAIEQRVTDGLFCDDAAISLCSRPFQTSTVTVTPGSGCSRRRLSTAVSFDVRVAFESAEKMSTENLEMIESAYKSEQMREDLKKMTNLNFDRVENIATKVDVEEIPNVKKLDDLEHPILEESSAKAFGLAVLAVLLLKF